MSGPPTLSTRFPAFPATFPYPPSAFTRADPSPDRAFYASPRLVTHIDVRCIAALTAYYGSVLPVPSQSHPPKILDLCSSWISHLPPAFVPPGAEVVGLGMNASELSTNPALSRHVVHDLNAEPALLDELGTGYDAAVCAVSVDYLARPLEVMRELARVMRPGASAHMAFSNRCFPTKVVRRWLEISETERCDMVASYFHFAGTNTNTNTGTDDAAASTPAPACAPGQLFEDVEIVTVLKPGREGDPLWVVRARRTDREVPV